MKMRQFGKLGIERSAFGLGCMRWPMIEVDGKKVIDEKLAIDIVRTAIDGGVNYVDTAYVYSDTQNEAMLGKALRDGYREKVMIATKLPSMRCECKEDLQRFFDIQIAALETDCIDFYLVHNLNKNSWPKMRDFGVLEFLDKLKAQGKIKYACFSFHDNYDLFEEIINAYDWDMCQLQFNFMDINNQAGLKGVELAGSKGIPVVIMEGLLGGKLAKAPDNVQALYDAFPIKRSPVEWAFRWLCNFPQVATVLSGVTSIEQTLDNLRIFDTVEVGAMSEEELKLMDDVREAYLSRTKVGCTGCRYCVPCPQGVEIPRIFSTWNNAFQYGSKLSGNGQYKRLIAENKDASQCVGCGACEAQCPQQIPIIEKLRQADEEMR